MAEAVDKSNKPSTQAGDVTGGKHEEGGIIGVDKKGNEVALHSKPGKVMKPGEGMIGIDPLNTDFLQDGDLVGNLETRKDMTATGTYHVHPGGESRPGYVFVQPPSVQDLRVTQRDSELRGMNGNSYVLGARNNTVYILAPSPKGAISAALITTFPLDKFISIK